MKILIRLVALVVVYTSASDCCLLVRAAEPRAETFQVYFPKGFDHVDANSATHIPGVFPRGDRLYSTGAMRYQQVYDSSVFEELPPEGAWLLALFFRQDCANTQGGSSSRTNIEILVSTTARRADDLSRFFHENAGPDRIRFVGLTNRTFEGGLGPCSLFPSGGWDTLFLGVPFYYNPSKGSLLIELTSPGARELSARGPVLLDAVDGVDGSSRIYSTSLTDPEAEFSDSIGLATQLYFIASPQLYVSTGTNGIVLTWPANPDPFKLQTSPDVAAGMWTDFNGVIAARDGGLKTTSIPLQNLRARQYFRLFWNSPQPGITSVAPEMSSGSSQP